MDLKSLNSEPNRHLRDVIFTTKLMPQEKVVKKFCKMDKCLNRIMKKIINSKIVDANIIDIITKIASGKTKQRNLYNRSNEKNIEIKTGDFKLEKDDCSFLENSILFLRHLQDTANKLNNIKKLNINREVYEKIISNYNTHLDEYIELKNIQNNNEERINYLEKILVLNEQKPTEIREYIDKKFKKYLKLKNQIADAYLKIVYRTAIKKSFKEEILWENIQNGTLGLLKSIACYSCGRNTTFSSHAKWWVMQSILLNMKSTLIKLPISVWQSYALLNKKIICEQKIVKYRYCLSKNKNGNYCIVKKIIGVVNTKSDKDKNKKEKIVNVINNASKVISMNKVIGEDKETGENNTLEDVIRDANAEELYIELENKDEVVKILNILSYNEQKLLSFIYGITEYLVNYIGKQNCFKEKIKQQLTTI